jgi:hypothetical protein
MSSQFPISSPYLFEKDKGVGFGSFYCGCTLTLLLLHIVGKTFVFVGLTLL